MNETSRVQKLLIEQNAEIDRLKNRIEQLEAALIRIWDWHPINVSRPHETIDAIRDFAFTIIKGKKDE